MTGDIRTEATVTGTVSASGSLQGEVQSETILAGVSVGSVEIIRGELPYYEGEYEVTPTTGEQIFPTKQTTMINDFVVHQIPYYETSNPSGGYTAIIGG